MGIFDDISNVKTFDNIPSLNTRADGKNRYRLRVEKLEVGKSPKKMKDFTRLTGTIVSAKGADTNEVGSKAQIYIMEGKFPSYAQKDVANMTKAIAKGPITKEDWEEAKKNPEVFANEELEVEVIQAVDKVTKAPKTYSSGEPILNYTFFAV